MSYGKICLNCKCRCAGSADMQIECWESIFDDSVNIAEMSQDERKILKMTAQRLKEGREIYGRLKISKDDRNFHKETLEEICDALMYAQSALTKMAAIEYDKFGFGDHD